MNSFILSVCLLTSVAGFAQSQRDTIAIAEGLTLIPLTEHLYQHVSYLETTDFGRVPCNGLIYINGNEAIICDTPPTDQISAQLLGWMNKEHPNVKVKALIVNHFHIDCLGGIREFHKAGVKSYALNARLACLNKKRIHLTCLRSLLKLLLRYGWATEKLFFFIQVKRTPKII